MMQPYDTCGLFGKLPMQSDFVSHFLPESLTQYWHGWLQASLSVSQEQLGDSWRAHYLEAPIWRFALMPGIVHEQAVAGLVMPSVDEVGRYFPLTMANLTQSNPWSALIAGQAWFDKLEYTALLALEDGISYSTFMNYFERLQPLEVPGIDRFTVSEGHSSSPNLAIHGLDQGSLNDSVFSLLDYFYRQQFDRYSLWWTEGTDKVAPCVLVCRGMPDSGQFAGLLDGKWQEYGWAQAHFIEAATGQQ